MPPQPGGTSGDTRIDGMWRRKRQFEGTGKGTTEQTWSPNTL